MTHSTDVRSPGRSGPRAEEENTRSRVLGAVLEHGPVSAADLGEMLDLTPAAVRRHLDALEQQHYIEVTMVRRRTGGAGRPARRYVVAPEGHAKLGDDYLEIATDALETIRRVAGPDAVRAFIQERVDRLEAAYRPRVEAAGDEVAERLPVLVQLLSEDGFAASTNEVAVGQGERRTIVSAQLCQGHCPVRELAARYPQFCELETDLIARLLGTDVRRLSTLAAGAHVCTTHVPLARPAPRPAAGAAPPTPADQTTDHTSKEGRHD
ncbi:helix-turn-helix transcriptional regulator [Kocuria flava]|uniref:helix-turn-helix transcriptional regulator n=1 Tax=Kocuria flava TaxID=446860 RepID=UPI002F929A01